MNMMSIKPLFCWEGFFDDWNRNPVGGTPYLFFFLKTILTGTWSKPHASLIRLVRKRRYEK